MNDSERQAIQRRGGDFWAGRARNRNQNRTTWFDSNYIIEHITRKFSGKPFSSLNAAFVAVLQHAGGGQPFPHAISIGAGTARREAFLVRSGIVGAFDIYEISPDLCERGRQTAEDQGVADRMVFHASDAFERSTEEQYDLVFWCNALHHMLDAEQAIEWSHHALKPGGVFFMFDFVGPSRNQWSDFNMEIGTRTRKALPLCYMINPDRPHELFDRSMNRIKVENLLNADPTEAADSSSIIPGIRKFFPQAEIIPLGGAIYQKVLREVIQNVDEDADRHILEFIMIIDDLMIELGESHFAFTCTIKRSE